MQITVCEFPNEASRHEAAWTELVRFLQSRPTDVVVLPEMPFCDWRMFMTKTIDLAVWEAALAAHDATIARFAALQTTLVLASRPVQIHGKRLNQAFCWTRDGGYRGAHAKYYLPDEPDGWEATWFAQGDRQFAPITVGPLTVGFQLCTELLFTEPAGDWPERCASHCGAEGDQRTPALAYGCVHGGGDVRMLCRLRQSPVLRQ